VGGAVVYCNDFVIGERLGFERRDRRGQPDRGITRRQQDGDARQASAHGAEGAAVRAVVVGVQVPVADHGPASNLAFVLEHKVDIAPTVIEPALEVEADVVAANIGTCRRVAADPVDDRTAIVAHDPVDVDPCLVAALVADADLPVDAVERRTVDAAVDAVPPFEAAVAETEPITAGRCQQGQQQHCGQGERGTNRLHAASPQVWRSDLFTVRQTTSSRVPRDRSHAESRLLHRLAKVARSQPVTLRHILRRAHRDDLPARVAGAGAQIDDPVRSQHHVDVVLDDDDRVALVDQATENTDQLAHLGAGQTRGRLVEHVDPPPAPPGRRDQLPCDLQALRFAARERGRRLAETQIPQPDLLQLPEHLTQAVLADEELDRLVDGQVEGFANVQPLVADLARFWLVALPSAHLAGHEDVGEEDHLDLYDALTLTCLAAAALHVEGEETRLPAALPGERLRCVQLADEVERLDVRHGIRAVRSPDRRLIHEHHVVDVSNAFQPVILTDRLAQVPLRGRLAGSKLALESAVEDVVYERALARAADTRNDGERAHRELDVDALQVVLAGAGQADARTVERPALADWQATIAAGEVSAGCRVCFQQRFVAALEHDRAAPLATARPQLDDVVRDLDRGRIVLDDQHAVAALAKLFQQTEQTVAVTGMQPDRRLIEHVERVCQRGAERVGEGDALRFTAGERACLALE